MTPKGRVGAILRAKNGIVEFLGYGEYVGDEIPPSEINPIFNSGNRNPKIILDNGDVVWGCECWWGSEERVRAMLDSAKKIVRVRIANYRSKEQE